MYLVKTWYSTSYEKLIGELQHQENIGKLTLEIIKFRHYHEVDNIIYADKTGIYHNCIVRKLDHI